MPSQRVMTFNGHRVICAEQLITLVDWWLSQQYRQRLANRYADGEYPLADDVDWAIYIGQAIALLDDYEDFHLDYLRAQHTERVANLRLTDPHSYALTFDLNTDDLADGWGDAAHHWWQNTEQEPVWFRHLDEPQMRPVAMVMERGEPEMYDQNSYATRADWNLVEADDNWMNINLLIGNFGYEEADYETDSDDDDDDDDENNNYVENDIIG